MTGCYSICGLFSKVERNSLRHKQKRLRHTQISLDELELFDLRNELDSYWDGDVKHLRTFHHRFFDFLYHPGFQVMWGVHDRSATGINSVVPNMFTNNVHD